MPYGQPFYNYGVNLYSGQNNGYVAPQQQYGNLYGQPQNTPQNINNGVVGQYQQQVQQQAPHMQQVPPRTNISPVASLVDAMSRTSEPNTNIYYADQDQPFIYQISIDMQGRKTYKTFKIEDITEQTMQHSGESIPQEVDLSAYATKSDLQAFKDEIMGMASAFVTQQSAQSTQPTVKAKSVDKIKTDKE